MPNQVRTDFVVNLGNSITQINTFQQHINNTVTQINNISAQAERNGGLFGQILGGNLAAQAISQVTGLLISGGQSVLDYSSKLEQARIGFTTMTGSAIIAQKHLVELQTFARTTPFQFDELVTASQKLQGVGFSAEKVVPVLKDVGNALAASGRIDSLPFATKALGDIQAKGRLQGQEIIQLANAGIPAIKVLAGALNKTNAEVLELSKNGQISSDVFFEALHRYSESNFGGALEAQSKTFNGAMSNIKDALSQTSEVAFRPLYQKVSTLAVELSAEIGKQENDLNDVGGLITKYISEGVGIGFSALVEAAAKGAVESTKDIFTTGKLPVVTSIAEGLSKGINESVFSKETNTEIERKRKLTLSESINELIFGQKKVQEEVVITDADFKKLNENTPDLAAKLNADKAAKELEKLNETVNRLNISKVDSIVEVNKARIEAGNGSSLEKIRETSELETLAIQEKLRLLKEYNYDQFKSLSKEDRNGAKGTQLALQSVESERKLLAEQETLRLKTQKQVEDVIQKMTALKGDFNDFISAAKLNDNPFVKVFSDIDTAGERAEKRFKDLGKEAVKFAAEADKIRATKQLNELRFDTNLNALKFSQEAKRLAATPESQFADFKRALERVEFKADSLAKITGLNKQISEADYYAFRFNPNNPKTYDQSRFHFGQIDRFTDLAGNRGRGETFADFEKRRQEAIEIGIKTFDAIKDVKKFQNFDLEGTGALGKEAIADRILEAIPKREDLLRQLSSPYVGTRENAQFLLSAQSNALFDKKQAEQQKLQNFIENQNFLNFAKKDAYEQLRLLNDSQGLDREFQNKRFLSVTGELGNDLDAGLRRGRISALNEAAKTEAEKERKAEADRIERKKRDTKLDAVIENFSKLLGANGIKVEIASGGNQTTGTIRIVDESNGAAITTLKPAPTQKATKEFYFNQFEFQD